MLFIFLYHMNVKQRIYFKKYSLQTTLVSVCWSWINRYNKTMTKTYMNKTEQLFLYFFSLMYFRYCAWVITIFLRNETYLFSRYETIDKSFESVTLVIFKNSKFSSIQICEHDLVMVSKYVDFFIKKNNILLGSKQYNNLYQISFKLIENVSHLYVERSQTIFFTKDFVFMCL